jgi:hypothetical protein
MTELLEDWISTVSTDCQCLIEDEETGEEVTPDNCLDCGDWMLEDAHMTLEEWQKRNSDPEAALITGKNLGWMRLNGHAIARGYLYEVLTKSILRLLMLDGDFRLELKLEGKNLTARRWSHDEPTGCSFTLEPFMPCDGYSECLALAENIKEYEGRSLCNVCAEIEGVK